jgi:hypothetical protein
VSAVAHRIALSDVATTSELRIDAHHYLLSDQVREVINGIASGLPIASPVATSIANGINLPEAAYQLEADSEWAYVSVGAISQFALRLERTVSLKDPESHAYGIDVAAAAGVPGELWITRSGTPGIAWAFEAPDSELHLIPSGFVIRISLDPRVFNPVYVAAVLNHPVWRIWSASLSAGKRQRNLSQEHLAQLRIPLLAMNEQDAVAHRYAEGLEEISNLLAEGQSFRDVTDKIVHGATALKFPPLKLSPLTFDRIDLRACADSPLLRVDSRFHRQEVRDVISGLEDAECVRLGDLLRNGIVKGQQPAILSVDDPENDYRVIATVALQAGQVVSELTKPTTEDQIDAAGDRLVGTGDLLVTMDGEGSIGKVAVFDGEYSAVTDSHVAILRLKDQSFGNAIACFLSSSLGQAQIELLTSGSTGQTQLSKDDLAALRIPRVALAKSETISEQFSAAVVRYEALTRRVRRVVCEHSAVVSQYLIDSDALAPTAKAYLADKREPESLLALLDALRPDMF